MFLQEKYSDISSAMLTGYSVFTTFTAEKKDNEFYTKAFELHIKRLQNNVEVLFGEDNIPSRQIIVNKILNFLDTQKFSEKNEYKSLVRVAIYPKNFSIANPANISDIEILVTGREYNNDKTSVTLELHEIMRPLAHLKTSALFPSLQTRAKAQKNGYNDALFFYKNNITEGPAWNILFTKDNCVYFPDPSHKTFLEGFTQKLIKEELIKNYSETIQIKTEDISIHDVLNNKFDSAFIVSSGIDIVPIKSINNIMYNNKINNNINLVNIYDKILPENIQ